MSSSERQRSGVIDAAEIGKRYDDSWVVRDVSLQCGAGEIVTLLGPNGAGKTTTIEMLQGLRKPDAGRIRVLGTNPVSAPRSVRRKISVTLQAASAFFRLITVREAFELFAALYGVRISAAEAAKRVGLGDRLDTLYRNLSGGQRQRVMLGLALVNAPEVLFLDEPTTGLDPEGRREIWTLIRDARRRGCCLLMTTHLVDEAFTLSDRVGLIVGGRLVACDTPAALTERAGALGRIELFVPSGQVPIALDTVPGVASVRHDRTTGTVQVFSPRPELVLGELASVWTGFAKAVPYVIHRPTSEDTYFALAARVRGTDPAAGLARDEVLQT